MKAIWIAISVLLLAAFAGAQGGGVVVGNYGFSTGYGIPSGACGNPSVLYVNLLDGSSYTCSNSAWVLNPGSQYTAGSVAASQGTLLAVYRFTEGSGSTLTDYSGNGNNGTLASSTASPTWLSPVGLSFSEANSQYVTLPAALNSGNTFQFATYMAPCATPSCARYPVPSILGSTVHNNLNLVYGGNSGGPRYNPMPATTFIGTWQTQSNCSVTGFHIVTFVLDASADHVYVDGNECFYRQLRASAGKQTSGVFQLGGAAGLPGWFSGNVYYMAVYSNELTKSQVQQSGSYIAQFLSSAYGVQTVPAQQSVDFANHVYVIGDSISTSVNGATPYYSQLNTAGTYTITTAGISGALSLDMISAFPWQHQPALSLGGRSVCLIEAGTNDINGGIAASDTANNIISIVNACKAAGSRTVLNTMMSRTGIDAGKNSLNMILRGIGYRYADCLADVAANANLGADGAYANTTYFQDGTHPTTAGNAIFGAIDGACVDSIFGNNDFSSANTATGSYAMTASDVYLLCNPSGGSVTITAISPIGLTAQKRYIKNIQTAGANTCTVSTVDGGSVTIPNKGVVGIQSLLTSASAGGATWTQIQ